METEKESMMKVEKDMTLKIPEDITKEYNLNPGDFFKFVNIYSWGKEHEQMYILLIVQKPDLHEAMKKQEKG